jgi:hypothetical protein
LIPQLHAETQLAIPRIYANLLHLLWHGQLEANQDGLLFHNGLLRPDCCLRVKEGA